MKILLLGRKIFSHFQMGIVYIRKSFKSGQCLAHLQNIVQAEVSLLMTTRGLVQPCSCNALTNGKIQNCITCLTTLALTAVGKLHVLHIVQHKTLVFVEARQVRSLADPHMVSTLNVQGGIGTLNKTLALGAVHPRMEMQLPVLFYGPLLPQVHPFDNYSFLLKPLNNYQMASFTVWRILKGVDPHSYNFDF